MESRLHVACRYGYEGLVLTLLKPYLTRGFSCPYELGGNDSGDGDTLAGVARMNGHEHLAFVLGAISEQVRTGAIPTQNHGQAYPHISAYIHMIRDRYAQPTLDTPAISATATTSGHHKMD